MKVRMFWQQTGKTIGLMSDEGTEPRSDTPDVDELLAKGSVGSTRAERFAYYASGYSNGVWATEVVPA